MRDASEAKGQITGYRSAAQCSPADAIEVVPPGWPCAWPAVSAHPERRCKYHPYLSVQAGGVPHRGSGQCPPPAICRNDSEMTLGKSGS